MAMIYADIPQINELQAQWDALPAQLEALVSHHDTLISDTRIALDRAITEAEEIYLRTQAALQQAQDDLMRAKRYEDGDIDQLTRLVSRCSDQNDFAYRQLNALQKQRELLDHEAARCMAKQEQTLEQIRQLGKKGSQWLCDYVKLLLEAKRAVFQDSYSATTGADADLARLGQAAVKAAWEKEVALVKEGKGTRNWTVAQQAELLEFGKVSGFEGQHMKSKAAHPEFAGDPNNIQFLTYEEHLYGAHSEKFTNATDGRFDPATGKMIPFAPEEPPCMPVIDLKETCDPEQLEVLKKLGRSFGYARHEDIAGSRERIFPKAKSSDK